MAAASQRSGMVVLQRPLELSSQACSAARSPRLSGETPLSSPQAQTSRQPPSNTVFIVGDGRRPAIGLDYGAGVRANCPFTGDFVSGAARHSPPLYACCSPKVWDAMTVIRWLEERVFAEENQRVRRSDLEFYKKKFIQSLGERLCGEDLGQLMFAEYVARWGYSAPFVFECFLGALEMSEQKASSELSVVELWQLIRKKRPFETRHDLKREGSSGKAVTRKTPATLEPIHERMDSTTSDPALPVSPGSERPETPSQKDVEKDSKDPTVLGCNQSSSPSAVTAGLSGDFPDDNKPEDFASASNREVDAASMAMHWNEFRVVDMQPIGEFKHVLDMSDSDYDSPNSESPSLQGRNTPVDNSPDRSPRSSSGFSSNSSVATDSPKSSPGSGVKKPRKRGKRQRHPLPPLLKFPDSYGPIHLWEYLLELLNDRRYRDIAIWTNVDAGEFMLLDSEVVAALWGLHRNKTTMNYDKMSRALRYYYKKIINKVPNSRLKYRFLECTNWSTYKPQAIGYDYQHMGDKTFIANGRVSRGKRKPSSSEDDTGPV